MGNCGPSVAVGQPTRPLEDEAPELSIEVPHVAANERPLPFLLGRRERTAVQDCQIRHVRSLGDATCSTTSGSAESEAADDDASPANGDGSRPGVDDAQLLERSISSRSIATSGGDYAEADQTLIFLDWDDTLCPTTELLQRGLLQGLRSSRDPASMRLPADLEEKLVEWRKALLELLDTLRALSDNIAIVTCASSSWVARCVSRLVPELQPLLAQDHTPGVPRAGKISIISATELLRKRLKAEGLSVRAVSCRRANDGLLEAREEMREQMTAAKVLAMKTEAEQFYSRYPGQTWKNVLSFGDMPYEHDAVKELPWCHAQLPRERLRIKAMQLPQRPSVESLTTGLQICRALGPTCVRYDGSLDLDLTPTLYGRRRRNPESCIFELMQEVLA